MLSGASRFTLALYKLLFITYAGDQKKNCAELQHFLHQCAVTKYSDLCLRLSKYALAYRETLIRLYLIADIRRKFPK